VGVGDDTAVAVPRLFRGRPLGRGDPCSASMARFSLSRSSMSSESMWSVGIS
jgi:hypothetical protein